MPRKILEPDEVRYSLIDLLEKLHLELTPYEDSDWVVFDRANKSPDLWRHQLVIKRSDPNG